MQAAEVKKDLCMLRERLAQCSAESKRHKELLRCLVGVECSPCPWGLGAVRPEPLTPPFLTQGKKQQELQETMEELSMENSVVAQSFQNNRQELQQLEGLVAQTKEHFQMTNREAATSLEEAEKRDQWSELAEALQERIEVKKLLRNKVQRLLERLECLQEPTTLGFLLFLAFLQLAILVLVLLKRDIFNWVLPPKMAVAFGSHPAKSQFF
ncbi:hypothetical protein GRJ2_000268300 [Grus japonensis]|uniref:Uncharacterized protein n=1 Tax=Grus japonensis TaxID=30415 RepID=A0ABC9VXA8_GRUJA